MKANYTVAKVEAIKALEKRGMSEDDINFVMLQNEIMVRALMNDVKNNVIHSLSETTASLNSL